LKNLYVLVTGVFFMLLNNLHGQTKKNVELAFSSDNGIEGVAYLENSFYFDENYKVDISITQIKITGYKTSIGYFSGTDLESHGFNFPIDCFDCTFLLDGFVGAFFKHQNKILQIPFKTSKYIESNAIMTLTVPFEIPDTALNYNQSIADWEQHGKFSNLKTKELNGNTIKELRDVARVIAKESADQNKLTELTAEIRMLSKEESIKKLYRSRSHFYNKQLVDNLIDSIRSNKTKVENYEITNATTNEFEKTENVIIVIPETNVSVTKVISEIKKPIEKKPSNQAFVSNTELNITPTEEEPVAEKVTINKVLATKNKVELKSIEDNSLNQSADILAALNTSTVQKEAKKKEPNSTELASLISSKNSKQTTSLSEIIEDEPQVADVELTKTTGAKQKKSSKKKKSKKASKLSKYDFDFTTDLSKYKRSSLHTIMLRNPNAEQADVIEQTFLNRPLPEKFNTHHIATNFISVARKARKQDKVISTYLNRNNIARDLVAKWFNRNERGEFEMNLVAERGHYNASVFDLNIARKSERGLAMLADAGEQLIANTFIIVNDYKYTNKEEVAKKAGFLTSLVSAVATAAGADDVAMIADAATVTTAVVGKGYVVKVTSYLYRLKWNEKIANTFYEEFWIDANNFDSEKKRAFDKTDLFELELVGYETDFSGIQSSAFTSKSNAELIEKATIKATDQTIAKLQRKFEIFRTKTPLISAQPLAAKIGMKEGLEKGDKFEVLEQYLDKDGTIAFNRVGIIKVDKNSIWDNRYKAYEENNSTTKYTSFKGGKDKFYEGMLIRQIN